MPNTLLGTSLSEPSVGILRAIASQICAPKPTLIDMLLQVRQ